MQRQPYGCLLTYSGFCMLHGLRDHKPKHGSFSAYRLEPEMLIIPRNIGKSNLKINNRKWCVSFYLPQNNGKFKQKQ